MRLENFSSQQRQWLGEILQDGLDRAADALSIMLNGQVVVRIVPPFPCHPDVCLRLGLSGALEGGIRIELPEDIALEMVKTLTANRASSLRNEVSHSALLELGNVLTSFFVGYFDQSRGLRTLPTPSELSFAPRELSDLTEAFSAELCWSKFPGKAKVLISLQQSALEILLA